MIRAATGLGGTVLAAVLLAACTNDAAPAGSPTVETAQIPTGDDDVASPELVALRERAGIADCPATRSAVAPHEDGLPSVTLPCLGGGREVDLAGMRGEPLVVNLWASYCGPCRDELPILQQLHERAGGRVRMIGVDFTDPHPAAALQLAATTGVTYPQVADPQGLLRSPLRIVALPVTVLVDPDGHVAYTKFGPVSSYDELVGLVREHLGVSV